MAAGEGKKAGGGAGGAKTQRTETVTVRLEPKIRYLAELAAKKQRRTLSSFIEWAVQESFKSVLLYQGSNFSREDERSVDDEAASLWDVDASERFARLAIRYPELLAHEEQEQWKLLMDSGLLNAAKRRDSVSGDVKWNWPVLHERVFPILRDAWPIFQAAYEAGTDAQRTWVADTKAALPPPKGNPPGSGGGGIGGKPNFSDMDDDIPF